MNTLLKAAPVAASLSLALLLTGCGWFSRPDRAVETPYDGAFQTLGRALGTYEIYFVDPDQGPLAGGQQVRLDGFFPTMLNADQIYSVYIDSRFADYDTSFSPYFSSDSIYVITPPGDAPGLVDVALFEAAANEYAAILVDGYEYLDPNVFEIISIVPDRGPLAGGQEVTVFGQFPVASAINTIAEAYESYLVYIDGNFAPFNDAVTPIVTSEYIYAITPPGAMPGFVNVAVVEAQYADAYFVQLDPDVGFAVRTLVDGYEYVAADLEITNVTPDNGFLIGLEPAVVEGMFPIDSTIIDVTMSTAAQAAMYYTVYFGSTIAPFDDNAPPPIITQTEMKVVSPRGPDVGFVDVMVVENADPLNFAVLEMGFRYYSMLIHAIYPDQGPVDGGTLVRIDGIFPTEAIFTASQAYATYNVVFDNLFQAGYNTAANPIITEFPGFENIQTISDIYRFYNSINAVTPPHPAGFVDVRVESVLNREPPIERELLYEYIGFTDNVGEWIDASVTPNPVGPVRTDELEVMIEVSGTVGDGDSVFIVPQGGNPAELSHRIDLTESRRETTASGNLRWFGRNTQRIETDMFGGTLYPDGHAAIFIEAASADPNSGETTIIGDDFDPPYDEDGRIQNAAHRGRHFIIDTLPPRMIIEVPPRSSTADRYILTSGPSSDTYHANNALFDSVNSPVYYPLMPSVQVIDGTEAQAGPTTFFWDLESFIAPNELGAGMFFNTAFLPEAVSSDLNPETNLTFVAQVLIEDEDLYTVLGIAPDAARDTDRFAPGGTNRQIAGFDQTPAQPNNGAPGPFSEILMTGDDVLVQWDTTGSNFGDPEDAEMSAQYVSEGTPIASGFDGGNVLGSSFPRLRATWNFNPGIPPDSVPLNYRLAVQFRAADRATNYLVAPRNPSDPPERVKVVTSDDRLLPPLTVWWMRDVQLEIEETGIPADEITQAPGICWKITSAPRPATVYRPKPLYSYSIWVEAATVPPSTPVGSIEQRRDGEFALLNDWTQWSTEVTCVPQSVMDSLVPGRWYVVVASVIDEAGNIVPWPLDDLEFLPNGNFLITKDATSAGRKSWSSFFLKGGETIVDTRISPKFFHEFNPSTGS
jgi:hypothetical protein